MSAHNLDIYSVCDRCNNSTYMNIIFDITQCLRSILFAYGIGSWLSSHIPINGRITMPKFK